MAPLSQEPVEPERLASRDALLPNLSTFYPSPKVRRSLDPVVVEEDGIVRVVRASRIEKGTV
jgi:hypothetical protein